MTGLALNNEMPLGTGLNRTLKRVRSRIRFLLMVRYGSLGLLIGTSVGIVAVILAKVHLLATNSSFPVVIAGVVLSAILIGLMAAWLTRLGDLDIARLTERRADLKERLSSALEFGSIPMSGATSDFVHAQRGDADHYAGTVAVDRLFPIVTPRTFLVGLLLSAVLFGTFFLPTLPAFWNKKQKQEAEEVKVTAISLKKIAEDKEKAADQQNLKETQQAAREVKALANKMKAGELPKKESLVALQKLTQKFEEKQKKLEDQAPKKKLDEAARQLKRSMDELQKQMDQAEQDKKDKEKQDQAKNGKSPDAKNQPKSADKLSPEDQKKQEEAQKAMKEMMDQMRKIQEAMEKGDSPEMRQQMEQALQKMAQTMQQHGSQMNAQQMQMMQQSMQQLAQSLQSTQMQDMAASMQQLAQQMQQSNLSQSEMDALAKALSKCAGMCKGAGKGMGSGMAALDASSLAELVKALKEGRLTMNSGKSGSGGNSAGRGINGQGHETSAMKDPGATKPRLLVGNVGGMSKAAGKQGDMKEFAKYLAMSSKPSKHAPNGGINGVRTQQGDELQINFTGDPEAFQSSSPYYKAVETSKKQAESTLDKENIPAAYKKQVRDYFDSVH